MSCVPHSIICEILYVWGSLSRKERPNGYEYFMDIRHDIFDDVCTLGVRLIGPGVVEI